MRNISKKTLLIALLLIFIPSLVFAADTPFGLSMANIFDVKPSDYSVIFLKRIFGDVGYNLSSMSGGQTRTILGELFRVFNLGILTIASFVMVFTVVKVVMETAHSGQMMGQRGHGGWLVVRTTVGLAALVPSFSGYSFLQAIVMWFILQGVGFANAAWSTSLDYLNKNGVIYTTSKELLAQTDNPSVIDTALVSAYLSAYVTGTPVTNSAAADNVALAMACMYNVEHAINDTLTKKSNDMKGSNAANYSQEQNSAMTKLQDYFATTGLKPNFDDATKTLTIPNAIPPEMQKYWKDYVFKGAQTLDISAIGGACGVYNWAVDPNVKGADEYESAKKAGLQWQVENLAPLGKRLVNIAYNGEEERPKVDPNLDCDSSVECQAIVGAASQYQTAVYSSRLAAVKKDDTEDGKNWIDDAKRSGWAMAGSYYYELGKITNENKIDAKNYQVTVLSQALTDYYSDDTRGPSWNRLATVLNSAVNPQYMNALAEVFEQIKIDANSAVKKAEKMNQDAKKQASGKEIEDLGSKGYFKDKKGKDFNPGAISIVDFMTPILNRHTVKVVDTWLDTMTNSEDNPNPIVNLMTVGNKLMDEASAVWNDIFIFVGLTSAGTFLVASAAAVAGAWTGPPTSASTPFFDIGAAISNAFMVVQSVVQMGFQLFSTIAFMGLPLVIGITTPMYATGAMLAIYIPLLPFTIFTLGVISWLILVIESMAAAPLVALGLTHPEGHDLLGKSDQAVMLLLNVFLRPICMIIGLVAAMVLSYIALSVLNAGFGIVVSSVFDNPKNSVKAIMILVIYTFIVMALINQCFAMIYVVGDKIGNWIGMPSQPSDIEKHLEGVKQGTQQGLQEGAGGAGQAIVGSKAAVGDVGATGIQAIGGAAKKIAKLDKKRKKENELGARPIDGV